MRMGKFTHDPLGQDSQVQVQACVRVCLGTINNYLGLLSRLSFAFSKQADQFRAPF